MTPHLAGSGTNPRPVDPDRFQKLLAEAPRLGGLYARGVARSVLLAARRGRPMDPFALPARELHVRGLQTDADHLTAYQHLLGEPGTDVLPAGFVHVLAFPVATALMVEPDFPLPLLGMVHLSNLVTQHRPVRIEEPLDIAVHARGLTSHRSGVSIELVARVHIGGEPVWEGVSTYLAKGARLAAPAGGTPGDGDLVTPEGVARDGATPEPASPWIPPTPTGLWHLGRDVARAYAAVSGDRNPIHTSALAARAFGFRRPIAHGMHTAARALADVGAARGDAFTWSVDFARPVLLPGSVTVGVSTDGDGFAVTGWDARSGRRHLDVAVRPA